MSREIKFRAWNGEYMIYPEDSKHDTVKTASAHILKHYDTVMQYTGLKDRNGVEIYEGDIVRAKSHSPSDYVIQFIEGGYCATHENLSGYPIDLNHFYPSIGCQIEVISNIHTKTDSNVQP